jgi:hypothetical protein
VIDAEPALVPVKISPQLVTPDTVPNVQDVKSKLPPVVPGVTVNVTVPVGAFDAVVVSTTCVWTLTVQLLPPRGIMQLTLNTVVEVLSNATVIVLDVSMLPL